jgi:hypothetical protein
VHLFGHRFAVVLPRWSDDRTGLPSSALLITTLRSTAKMILLNTSVGDQAVVESRACGCPIEQLGWTTHLSTVRSFEKLTAAGMTFRDHDVIRVLEETLPARYGGSPIDYQLVESEADDGTPCLRLLVHPALGSVDPEEVRQTFLAEISRGSGVERVMGLAWDSAQVLEVERRAPVANGVGKILHLYPARARL